MRTALFFILLTSRAVAQVATASVDSAFPSFPAACNNQTLIVGRTWPDLAALTCNASLIFAGGILKPAAGQNVAISLASAPPVRIFDLSDGGSVTFTSTPAAIYPEWWGARCDAASMDSSAAINAAAVAARNGKRGGEIVLSCMYRVANTVLLQDLEGARLKCAGQKAGLLWSGPAPGPILRLQGLLRSEVDGCYLTAEAAHQVHRRTYSAGALTLTHGSTAVTGVGTRFTSLMMANGTLAIGGNNYQIRTVNGPGSITLLPENPYSGATASGIGYSLAYGGMAIEIMQDPSGTGGVGSSSNHLHDMVIESGERYIDDGIVADNVDNNNDFMVYEGISFFGMVHSCIWIKGGQTYNHMIRDTGCFFGPAYGFMATAANGGPGGQRASFSCDHVWIAAAIADTYFDGYTDAPMECHDMNDETYGMLVYAVNQNPAWLKFSGVRFVRLASSNRNPEAWHVSGGFLEIERGRFFSPASQLFNDMTAYYAACPGGCTVSPASMALRDLDIETTRFHIPPGDVRSFFTGDAPNQYGPRLTNVTFSLSNVGNLPPARGYFTLKKSDTGTVSLTRGSSDVKGVNTAFDRSMAGSVMTDAAGNSYNILSVADATHLKLQAGYEGAPNPSESYAIYYGGQSEYIPSANLQQTGNQKYLPVNFSALAGTCGGGMGEGAVASIQDANSATPGAMIGGHGTHHVLAYCDGNGWTVMTGR